MIAIFGFLISPLSRYLHIKTNKGHSTLFYSLKLIKFSQIHVANVFWVAEKS